MSNFKFNVFIPSGMVHCVALRDEKKSPLPIAWALVSIEEGNMCRLWDILVRDQYRRQGYGKAIIVELQNKYDIITTNYGEGLLNTPGINLCLKCGFKVKSKLFRKKAGELIWQKQ